MLPFKTPPSCRGSSKGRCSTFRPADTPNDLSLSFLSLWDTCATSSVLAGPHQSHNGEINEQQCQMLCSQLLLPLQPRTSFNPPHWNTPSATAGLCQRRCFEGALGCSGELGGSQPEELREAGLPAVWCSSAGPAPGVLSVAGCISWLEMQLELHGEDRSDSGCDPERRCSFHYTLPCCLRALWGLLQPPYLAPTLAGGGWRGKMWAGSSGTGEFPGELSQDPAKPALLPRSLAGAFPSISPCSLPRAVHGALLGGSLTGLLEE